MTRWANNTRRSAPRDLLRSGRRHSGASYHSKVWSVKVFSEDPAISQPCTAGHYGRTMSSSSDKSTTPQSAGQVALGKKNGRTASEHHRCHLFQASICLMEPMCEPGQGIDPSYKFNRGGNEESSQLDVFVMSLIAQIKNSTRSCNNQWKHHSSRHKTIWKGIKQWFVSSSTCYIPNKRDIEEA